MDYLLSNFIQIPNQRSPLIYQKGVLGVRCFSSINDHTVIEKTWNDCIYRYYSDNSMEIFFVNVKSGIIDHSDFLIDNILVDYDVNNKIVAVGIYNIKINLACVIDSTQLLSQYRSLINLSFQYFKMEDLFVIFFIAPETAQCHTKEKISHNFIVIFNDKKEIEGFFFLNASNQIRNNSK